MRSVAIIGTGIAGMSAAARMASSCDLTLYERNGYVGGHTNTVEVFDGHAQVPVDTGFMVYNEVTYPRLTQLFDSLGVETMETDMSFGVYHVGQNLYWSSRLPTGLFAQRRNLGSPRFWRLLSEINRFNRSAQKVLNEKSWAHATLADFIHEERFSRTFLDLYLLPMIAAIWTSPHDQMLEFPASTLIRFLHNHGLLGFTTQHPWRTIKGGSRSYREKLIAPFRERIQTHRPAVEVTPTGDGKAAVTDDTGARATFDAVVIATHADEARALLRTPTFEEDRLLSAFRYGANTVALHSDPRVMPPRRSAWASWNYRVEPSVDKTGPVRASTHYWMNRLQGVSDQQDFFVSVNAPTGTVHSDKLHWKATYHHPYFDLSAARAQTELSNLNRQGPLYFAGSYFRYGFHEDALMAGQDAADAALRHLHASSASIVSL